MQICRRRQHHQTLWVALCLINLSRNVCAVVRLENIDESCECLCVICPQSMRYEVCFAYSSYEIWLVGFDSQNSLAGDRFIWCVWGKFWCLKQHSGQRVWCYDYYWDKTMLVQTNGEPLDDWWTISIKQIDFGMRIQDRLLCHVFGIYGGPFGWIVVIKLTLERD